MIWIVFCSGISCGCCAKRVCLWTIACGYQFVPVCYDTQYSLKSWASAPDAIDNARTKQTTTHFCCCLIFLKLLSLTKALIYLFYRKALAKDMFTVRPSKHWQISWGWFIAKSSFVYAHLHCPSCSIHYLGPQISQLQRFYGGCPVGGFSNEMAQEFVFLHLL